ncbi:sulfotransferase family 2 domain-containing protein [Microbulbifer elongatus]|uniref:sulfotransferase family 2 domain-containing protein n=1 Tax=Microbulbifer elongatus TaxID=86173 RepID=UPI001E3AC780|nr:sulfotransferase family 2 domain-containing protein [Microbulbifer elongatus]
MDPIVFIHVPKTAGTSFRSGADAFFGSGRVCRDYGAEAAETSGIVRQWMNLSPDNWMFRKAFEREGYQLLAGHFHAARYVSVFGVQRMVTFLRNPLQRTVSEYTHFVRNNGFEGTFEEFYRAKQNINRQFRILGNLPWVGLGFIGFTDQYEQSLNLLNRKFNLAIPELTENLSRDSYADPYEITEEQEMELRKLNAAELHFYGLAREQFEWRKTLSGMGSFVAGVVMKPKDGRLGGWAVADEGDEPVALHIKIDGKVVGEAIANEDRPGLREKGVKRGGFVGFTFDVSGYRPGSSIECLVAETGQPLVQSPRLLPKS